MSSNANSTESERSAALSKAVAEVARRLLLGPAEMGQILGVSQDAASRLLQGEYRLRESGKEWELSIHLIRLYRALFILGGGDDAFARAWLQSTNLDFSGQRPADVIKRGDGLLQACGYVEAHLALG